MNAAPSGGGAEVVAAAQAVLQTIGLRARQSNQLRVDQLSEALAATAHGSLTSAERQRAIDAAHQLIGSAGTFGYDRVSQLARQLELFFLESAATTSENAPDEHQLSAAGNWLVQMEQDLRGLPEEQTGLS